MEKNNKNIVKKLRSGAAGIASTTKGRARTKKREAKTIWRKDEN